MNERDIAYQLVALLDEGTQHLDDRITRRLAASRQKALSLQRVAATQPALAGLGGMVWRELGSFSRSWIALVGLALVAAGTHYWGETQRRAEIEEVDSALLADDLPIDAYLDRGFDAWLKNDSHV